ncbi:MAG: DUF362 domain-containing protein [bacterium]
MSKVFFTKDVNNVASLFDAAGFKSIISPEDFVALKIHFGEKGNTAYIKPDRVKPIIDKVKVAGGHPFWTDSNTLYKGSRGTALTHLSTAFDHGYTFENTGAHVVIADGLEGKQNHKLPVNLKYFKEVLVGGVVIESDALIALTHFKGHEVAGFGGAIKNISMGFASRAGKQQMHSDLKPFVDETNCTSCGKCIKWCPTNAINFAENKKAFINLSKCIGCGECVAACRFDAIGINWQGEPDIVQKKMAEYAYGITKHFKHKTAFINFITDVSPNCDCFPNNDTPIIPDVGILASSDPVAIDQASIDLVNKSAGKDILREIHGVDWSVQLKYAEEIGLGSREYELVVK